MFNCMEPVSVFAGGQKGRNPGRPVELEAGDLPGIEITMHFSASTAQAPRLRPRGGGTRRDGRERSSAACSSSLTASRSANSGTLR